MSKNSLIFTPYKTTDMTTFEQQKLDRAYQEMMTRTWVIDGYEINLARRGWSYGYNNRKTSFGVCRIGKYNGTRRIEISRAFIRSGETYEKMLDTIAHEIAHALDYEFFGNMGHGHTWKACCAVTGADPQACHESENAPKGRYEAVCKTHGVVGHFHRKPKRQYLCNKCRSSIHIKDTKC